MASQNVTKFQVRVYNLHLALDANAGLPAPSKTNPYLRLDFDNFKKFKVTTVHTYTVPGRVYLQHPNLSPISGPLLPANHHTNKD